MGSTKRNNKRGSYIMEASLVLPVLIFAVITVVLIIMFFYSQMTQLSAENGVSLRCTAAVGGGITWLVNL